MISESTGAMQKQLNEGLRLATGPWRHLCEDLAGKDEYRAALTAMLLENTRKFYQKLDEDTKIANVGIFDKFAFPIIRAVFPNLIATEIVSVQPMEGPTSLVFFLETRYASTKGTARAGATNLSPLTGHNSQFTYSSEKVDQEAFDTGDGGAGPYTGTLAWLPIRPGSLVITVEDGNVLGHDDADGGLAGTGISTGTINYTNGAISVTFSGAVTAGKEVRVSYEYDSEGSSNIPQLDLMLSHAPVQAKPHKLRARWSVESAQDLKAVQGLDAEAELMAFLAEELRFEIDRQIIADISGVADSTSISAWSKTPPGGVSYYEHKLTFTDTLVAASNKIFEKTKRASANWLVCGLDVANVIETLPNFRPTKVDGAGIVHMGTLQGRWEVYKDPWMTGTDALMGYRGTSFADAGYVYAPYVPLYRTPTIYLDDMVGRVGLMSRFGKKMINDKFFIKVSITA